MTVSWRRAARAGQFATEQALDASFSAFLNQEGSLKALSAMTLNGGTLDNAHGVVGAGGALNIGVTTLDNRQGTLFSSADALLHADRLDNQGGQLAAQRALTFHGGQLINDNSGLIQSGDSLTLTADDISNRSGSIISSANATLRSQQLQNGGGEIQSVGDLLIDSAHGVVDNVAGLIRSLTVRNSGELNNRNGGLAASGTVDIGGDKLALFNQDGTVKAGEWLRIDADSLDGSGQLLSLGNMALSSRQSLNNRGTMVANGRFTLTSTGDIVNGGKLLAGSSLDITSRNLNNGVNGEINAGQNTLNVSDTLFNAGLIDGGYTRINAGTLTNSGSGRIYGNAIGVNALTFNNLAENGTAATLAGRERVDLGVQTLNNRDHGLIYSGGDLLIGGALADNGAATSTIASPPGW